MENNKTAEEILTDPFKLAEWMHDNYETIAKGVGWNTQESTKVSFDDLPELNRKTMLMLSQRVIALANNRPPSKVGEVSDDEIKKQAKNAVFVPDPNLSIYEKGYFDGFKSFLLQPQPVNSEGKDEGWHKMRHPSFDEAIKMSTEAQYKYWQSLIDQISRLNDKLRSLSSEEKKDEADIKFLAHLVDVTWGHANEDNSVPSTGTTRDLIAKAVKTFDPKDIFAEQVAVICGLKTLPFEQGEAKEPTDEQIWEILVYSHLALVNQKKIPQIMKSEDEIYNSFIKQLRSLFRSSEVKEQEITDEMIKVEGRKRATHHITGYFDQTKCDWFCRGGEFVRSLQVKSNEQTKTV